MNPLLRAFLVFLTGIGSTGSALALSPGDPVDNFRLLDHRGASHELYYWSDAKAVVLMAHGNGCGILLRKEANFRFQMHYTPNGKTTTDVTRVGYYFYDERPKYSLHMTLLMDTSLSIPANAKAYSASLEHVFDRAVVLFSLMPHAHLRGRSARFTAHYPDGREEVLLSVPKYDFSWQTAYALQPPKALPAGTRIVFDMTWDYSAQNPANPDPNRIVYWGEQTWDEMNVGWIRYRYTDENAGGGDKTAQAPERDAR